MAGQLSIHEVVDITAGEVFNQECESGARAIWRTINITDADGRVFSIVLFGASEDDIEIKDAPPPLPPKVD